LRLLLLYKNTSPNGFLPIPTSYFFRLLGFFVDDNVNAKPATYCTPM